MDDLATLAMLSEQRMLRDIAAHAARRAEIAIIEGRMASLRLELAKESAGTANTNAPVQQAHARYVQNTNRRLTALLKQHANLLCLLASSREDALRSFGRNQAVDILRQAAKTRRRAALARKEEAMLWS